MGGGSTLVVLLSQNWKVPTSSLVRGMDPEIETCASSNLSFCCHAIIKPK